MNLCRILADCAFLASVFLVVFGIRWLASLCAGPRPLRDSAEDWGHEDPYPASRLRLVVKAAEKTIPIHNEEVQ